MQGHHPASGAVRAQSSSDHNCYFFGAVLWAVLFHEQPNPNQNYEAVVLKKPLLYPVLEIRLLEVFLW